MARLLNAIECEDCIVPSPRTQQHYSLQFWTDFSKTPDRNLQDITYRGAWREKQDYYYCVAYVGEQEYMKGYPQATSPICGGKFCGQNAITKPEFFQAVLNIIDETIMKNYQANRADIKNRVAKLSPASYQYRVLVEKDLQAIQSADTKSKAITTSDQFQAYLKYCMFNLSQCGFQTFGNIGYGYWPVSELNVLIREGIITRTDIENIYDNLKGSDALKILYYVYRNYSKCSVNDDYDCDTISNKDDNCPYTYNPNQLDMDYDGKGNVCDDDIDGDGKKNPEGIVDDNDNIIIGKWDPEGDDTPLGEGKRGFGLFINVQTLTDTIPARITAKVITDGDLQSLQRSMDDGKNYTTTLPSIMHTYNAPGTYTISVLATDKSGKKAEASTKVYIAPGTNLQYQLAIQPAFTFKNGEIEYAFSASSKGDLDGIVRSFNNKDITEVKINEAVKKTFPQNETITVHAKAYYQNELKAVASMTLIHASSPKFSSLQVTKGTLQTPTSITTNLVGQRVQEITNILRNWGDGTTTTGTSLTASHLYPSSGIKTLQQTIFLKNGQHLENVVTFFVENPFKSHSMALNINGTQFSYAQAQATNLSLSLLPISSATPISITNTFGVNQTQTFPATPLSKIKLQTTYTSAGSKTVTSFGEINRCVSLVNQGTVYVSSADRCLTALKNGTLSQYKCDMDGDSIPDICDDDIDGDGKKNLLGLIQYEKADCSYDSENIDEEILRKHFGVCSLDNCPFALNSDQVDLNNNGIGDLCESRTVRTISTPVNNDTLRKYDQDKDGIPDDVDLCPSIPGDRAHQGCPGF
ncbi:MAG: thrombospondin type 3 repeat-containing protein [Candidatus Peribacteria bacterium]|jgi:hypothetical protein|nr:thrombospondin type 3 repeat-containing protein [Candidatus Peribacteria bacterium]